MSNHLSSFDSNIPMTKQPDPPNPFTKTGRAMMRSDAEAVVQARNDYNAARLVMHRNELNHRVEIRANHQRTEMAADTALNIKDFHEFINGLVTQADPHLEMMLRDLQHAYNMGEAA